MSPADLRARYPGRAILVDAGTNKYATSLGYLIPAYAALGIHFDAIYAWEAADVDAKQYWVSVPDDVKPRLHFYNAPISAEPGSGMNPVDWIKALHKAGDFIVFKLDVDNEAIERALVDQIAALDDPGALIAEMFYEKHYDTPDMNLYFAAYHFDTTYAAAIKLMQKMRQPAQQRRWTAVAGVALAVTLVVYVLRTGGGTGGGGVPTAPGGRRAGAHVTEAVAAVAAMPAKGAQPPSPRDFISIKPTFAASGTDKLPRHGYHRFYDQFLQPLYGKAVRMVEIGVLNGESLHAWQTVFEPAKSTIFGVSWPETQQVKTKLDSNVHVLFRDQSNCAHLDDVAATAGAEPLDLVIDDGSHEPGHQLKTLVKLFPRVAPGGFYVIEDIETSYWDGPGAAIYGYPLVNVGVDTTGSIMPAMRLLVEVLHQRYAVPSSSYDRTFHVIDAGVDPDVAWVMFAQNMVVIRKKDADDRAYEVPITNIASGASWKAYWQTQRVRGIVEQAQAWKC